MSFFMVLNGQFNQHHFDYLHDEFPRRLERTLAHGEPKKPIQQGHQKPLYTFELMSRNIYKLKMDQGLDMAKEMMLNHRIHHLPIVDKNDKLVGLLSDRDLLKLEENKLFNLIIIKDIMSHIVVACSYDSLAADVAKVLVREQISALPVVDENQELTGIISRVDILKAVVDKKFLN